MISGDLNYKEMENLGLIDVPMLNYQVVFDSVKKFKGIFDEDMVIKEKGIEGLFKIMDDFQNKGIIVDTLDSFFYDNLIPYYPKNEIKHSCPECKKQNYIYGISIHEKSIHCLHEFQKEIMKNKAKYVLRL
jgi:hypothetical protein